MRLALQAILNGADSEDDTAQCRGWKFFLLLLRLLLFRTTTGGLIPQTTTPEQIQFVLSRRVGTIVVTVKRMCGSCFPRRHKLTPLNAELTGPSLHG